MKKKLNYLKVAVIPILLLFLMISHITGIGCIWRWLFHIPCPGCGFTRAIWAALHLHFKEAFYYHPMFWCLPILIALYILDGRLFKNKKLNAAVLILLGVGFAAVWIFRLINLFFI